MNRRTFIAANVIGAVSASAFAAEKPAAPRVPRLVGDWWQISYSPELPEIDSPAGQVVDHCVFQAADGSWQLWSQIRGTAVGRLFYRWESKGGIEQPNWDPHGICWRADKKCGESWNTGDQDWIHAPHVIREGGEYVMYYGGGASKNGAPQIAVATSKDGVTFTRVTDAEGRSEVFAGPGYARDPMVMKTPDGYTMYYAADQNDEGLIAARTSPKPYGAPWSEWTNVSEGGVCGTNRTSQQCPYVVRIDGIYYLFKMGPSDKYETAVYHSTDPMDFGKDDDQLVTVLKASAAEVIHADGKWYLSSLIPGYKGVRLRRLEWIEDGQ